MSTLEQDIAALVERADELAWTEMRDAAACYKRAYRAERLLRDIDRLSDQANRADETGKCSKKYDSEIDRLYAQAAALVKGE